MEKIEIKEVTVAKEFLMTRIIPANGVEQQDVAPHGLISVDHVKNILSMIEDRSFKPFVNKLFRHMSHEEKVKKFPSLFEGKEVSKIQHSYVDFETAVN